MKNICYIPAAIGELWDKYTILLIKLNHIKNREKLELVQTEIKYLEKYLKKYPLNDNIFNLLSECNQELWNIENNIRIKEEKKEFDEEFIKLARNVYKTNDVRAKLKNRISVLFNSGIIEVKSYDEKL